MAVAMALPTDPPTFRTQIQIPVNRERAGSDEAYLVRSERPTSRGTDERRGCTQLNQTDGVNQWSSAVNVNK